MFSDVYAAEASANAYEALLLMAERRTSGLVVANSDGTLAGFVSDGDIIRAIAGESEDKLDMTYVYSEWKRAGNLKESLARLKDASVLDLATRKVVKAELDQGMERACRLLSAHSIKKISVTENGKVVGVIARSSMLRYLVGDVSLPA